MKGYCQIEDIENYLLTTIDRSLFESQVEIWIEIMELYVENKTGRVFIADDDATPRKYDVKGRAENFGTQSGGDLFIDDCIVEESEGIELKIDDEVIDEDNYLLYPANSLPKTRIALKHGSGLCFTPGQQNIEVSAKWGYSVACPADISFATMILVAGIINYSSQSEGEVKSETIGSYSVTYKDERQWQDFERAEQILQSYIKIVI